MARILIVEDNEMNWDMLSRRLKRRGHEIYLAHDGIAGIAKSQALVPDLILMDMSLPIMDGWDATREIKGHERTAHVPIIALTAHALTGDRDRCLEVGCDDYAVKPVDFDALCAKIERLLEVGVDA